MKNFKCVKEFDTLLEGYNYCRENGPIPFVVRNCLEFLSASSLQIEKQINLEASIHGYNECGTHKVSGKLAFDKWSTDTLDFNIVDSSSSRGTVLLPLILRELNIANDIDVMLWLSYVLTLARVQSKVHIDPPFGSGWQFLAEGSKEWTIIDQAFFSDKKITPLPIIPVVVREDVIVGVPLSDLLLQSVTIAEPPFKILTTAKFSVLAVNPKYIVIVPIQLPVLVSLEAPLALLTVVDNVSPLVAISLVTTSQMNLDSSNTQALTNESSASAKYPDAYIPTFNYNVEQLSIDYPQQLYRTQLNPQDFISCPEDWPHSVYTSVKTCGLSGYMRYDKQ
jgi:hypothetical protein